MTGKTESARSGLVGLLALLFLGSILHATCEDLIDNDGDGLVDAADPDCLFIRADSNDDGVVDLTDGVNTLVALFLGGFIPCPDAADANDSGMLDVADATYTFSYLFAGGPPPPAPFPGMGADPTLGDFLDCRPPEA